MRLSYRGDSFHGWQSQPNAISVQSTIEQALSTVLRTSTPIVGAGRTDTGVNAAEMYAHFNADLSGKDLSKLILSLNRLCGKDISILDIMSVTDDAHARFDATERTYKYFVSYKKTPFLYPLSWQSPTYLDVDKMNKAAELLIQTSDFTSFAKLHSDTKTNICKVTVAKWDKWVLPFSNDENEKPNGLVFTITADRFLRNMVRAVVGTLVDVGRGKISLSDFENIIAQKDRCSAGTSMPAQALYLWKVTYPKHIFKSVP
jgi:tRNA pseudouridine38-40 synthase